MRRFLAGVTTVALVTAVPFAATPASAAPAEVPFQVTMGQVTAAPGGDVRQASLWGMLSRTAPSPQPLDVAFTVDFSDVAAFAEFELSGVTSDDTSVKDLGSSAEPDPCWTEGTMITCAQLRVRPAAGVPVELGWFAVSSTSAAAPGDSGQVHVSTRVNGGRPITTDALVQIGEPVDLAGVGSESLSAAPGGTVTSSPQVRNTGTTSVEGVVLLLGFARGLYTGSFRNCVVREVTICRFTTVLEPGRTYRVSRPLPLRVPRDAAAGSLNDDGGLWVTVATFEDWTSTFDDLAGGTGGTGPELTLEPVLGVDAVPQVDTDPDDDQAEVALAVTGRTRPDISAVGAILSGAVGDTVVAAVGLRNLGPGTLHPDLFANNALAVAVEVPGNVKVIQSDSRCYYVHDRSYGCWPGQTALPPGGSSLFAFTFQLTKARGEGGTVAVNADDWEEHSVEGGRNKANDSARLAAALPDDGSARDGSDRDGGAGLPITGPGAALGALLLVAGTAGVWFARRRRTRFTADAPPPDL